tara:strand:+ start:2936 stop:3106 length:171 start_codon:yes stop_codon:yes gene_type:complete
MLRLFVAVTPVAGAIILPLIVPITIAKVGLGPGVFTALMLSSIWFVAMLRTSEMPH